MKPVNLEEGVGQREATIEVEGLECLADSVQADKDSNS